MATSYKVLGQVAPVAAGAWSDLYTVPAATQAVVSTLTVVNRGISASPFRIAVRPGGAALDPKHYLAYDVNVDPADLLALTLGVTLAAGDVVSVYPTTVATLSFGLFGSELS